MKYLALAGVLAIAGCKQPIINVYPAEPFPQACVTPGDYVIARHYDGSFSGYVMPTPIATPTPEVVAGCPPSIKIDGHATPFDARISEDEPYCVYEETSGHARWYYYAWIPRGK